MDSTIKRMAQYCVKGEMNMEQNELLTSMVMELRRGTLVLSVLCSLDRPMYGYSLLSELSGHGIPVETNTLYPLLRRLESQGLLESEWNTEESKPRKYYKITQFGCEIREKLKDYWRKTADSMSEIMGDR